MRCDATRHGSEWMDRGLFIVNVAYLLWYLPGMTTRAAAKATKTTTTRELRSSRMTINGTDHRRISSREEWGKTPAVPGRYGQCETRASLHHTSVTQAQHKLRRRRWWTIWTFYHHHKTIIIWMLKGERVDQVRQPQHQHQQQPWSGCWALAAVAER